MQLLTDTHGDAVLLIDDLVAHSSARFGHLIARDPPTDQPLCGDHGLVWTLNHAGTHARPNQHGPIGHKRYRRGVNLVTLIIGNHRDGAVFANRYDQVDVPRSIPKRMPSNFLGGIADSP